MRSHNAVGIGQSNRDRVRPIVVSSRKCAYNERRLKVNPRELLGLGTTAWKLNLGLDLICRACCHHHRFAFTLDDFDDGLTRLVIELADQERAVEVQAHSAAGANTQRERVEVGGTAKEIPARRACSARDPLQHHGVPRLREETTSRSRVESCRSDEREIGVALHMVTVVARLGQRSGMSPEGLSSLVIAASRAVGFASRRRSSYGLRSRFQR
jgi:hypothetical protein